MKQSSINSQNSNKTGMENAMQNNMAKRANFAVIMLIGPIVLMLVVHLSIVSSTTSVHKDIKCVLNETALQINPAKIVDRIGMCNMYSMNVQYTRSFQEARNINVQQRIRFGSRWEKVWWDERSVYFCAHTKKKDHQCDIVCIRVFYAVAHFSTCPNDWACSKRCKQLNNNNINH